MSSNRVCSVADKVLFFKDIVNGFESAGTSEIFAAISASDFIRGVWLRGVGIYNASLRASNWRTVQDKNQRALERLVGMTANYRVSLEFVSYSDSELAQFAGNVFKSLTKNPAFPNPPISPPDFGKLADAFVGAAHAALQGGPQSTAVKNAARAELVDALRKEAHYVQSRASHELQALLSSGFYAASTNRSQAPLEKPVIARVENLATTQLAVRLNRVPNAKSYHVQINSNGNGTWQDVGIFTQSRRILVPNLTPGTTYSIRARAIGGSTGSSEWSDPVARMST
jgi:hypothetical protein